MAQADTVLSVDHLSVSYKVGRRWIGAVQDFQIEIKAGQIYGLVGESGSGKTTAANGIMRFPTANGRTEPGSRIHFLGEDISAQSRRRMQYIWGVHMAMVPQDPGTALNPSIRVGEQVAEILRQHLKLDKRAARAKTIEMFRRVRLAEPENFWQRYPHELSGGMQQRVVIAMALSTSPRLLILDEPTTNLDVTTEAAILDLIRDLILSEGASALYVTHNFGVVAQLCERVIVMYAGEIVEDAPVGDLFAQPLHPYTIGLLNSVLRLGQTKRDASLQGIPGHAPSLSDLSQGCVFVSRCPLAIGLCHTKPPLDWPADGRLVRCHRWHEIAAGQVRLASTPPGEVKTADQAVPERESLLTVEDLTKHFPVRPTVGELIRRVPPAPVRAVDGVTLSVQKGRTLGLVGESGSGKTTLARVIVGLEDRTAGTIDLMGVDVVGNVRQRAKEVLARLQMIFQNPQDSLNPYLTVGQAIRRPLVKLTGMSRAAADREVLRLLQAVNLRPEYAERFPSELSGGEKQRVAIARAFASDPALIVCDEPVSSLDVSVQAAVLNLLARLQEERDTSYLFISHDLAVVGYLADYIAVMYLGELFEMGTGRDLFGPPYHPYTEALVSAIPSVDPQRRTHYIRLSDDIPSPRSVPTGCRFHTRCPRKIGPICEQEEPPWYNVGSGHVIRCHIPPGELAVLQEAARKEGDR
ncbi:MAG TPA: ABC transporter ATP-binding protein [Aggregatilineaceae bacterium]|nr:ABC transporter ATP-binding protein [Aggregatilineaceae bacterium]